MNETLAIRLCLKHRDPVGFEFLVRKYRREAYHHAMIFLGNPEDAADACQESFSRAFAAIPNLSALDRFYPWFYRILRNCCLNMLNRRRTILNHNKNSRSGNQGNGTSDNPATIFAKQEEAAAVRRALDSLDIDSREILTLKYIQGKKYDDLSAIFEIPRGTVMSRLYHARKAFRQQYLRYCDPEFKREEGLHGQLR